MLKYQAKSKTRRQKELKKTAPGGRFDAQGQIVRRHQTDLVPCWTTYAKLVFFGSSGGRSGATPERSVVHPLGPMSQWIPQRLVHVVVRTVWCARVQNSNDWSV
jgi:hypothetical protein